MINCIDRIKSFVRTHANRSHNRAKFRCGPNILYIIYYNINNKPTFLLYINNKYYDTFYFDKTEWKTYDEYLELNKVNPSKVLIG